jgi:CRISPR-associated protein Cmr1
METFVRGVGGKCCSPETHSCKYSEESNDGLCDVCRIFGATGWRRRFRLIVRDSTRADNAVKSPIEAQRSHKDKNGKSHTPTWYFPSKPRSGQLTINVQSLAQDFQTELLAELIQFTADWTGIGARAQMGFGVIGLKKERIKTRALYDWLIATAGTESYQNLPSLKNIFLAQIKPKNSRQSFSDESTFNLKYDLRRLYASDTELRHFVMGTVKGRRVAAKVKMSRPYGDNVFRVWGWIPEESGAYSESWNRNTVLEKIHEHLRQDYTLMVWREMHSPRDCTTPNTSDAKVFLRSILGVMEDGDGT